MVLVIKEHHRLPDDVFKDQAEWKQGFALPPQKAGLDRWFFQWQWRAPETFDSGEDDRVDNTTSTEDQSGYYASYVIGAQWFYQKEFKSPIVIGTKDGCDKIDFLRMFNECFESGIATDEFSRIYDIDMSQPPIHAPEMKSVLSPLIVVHFMSIVKDIVKKGLKKDYVDREENLNKVKGRIGIFKNERLNIIQRRYDKVYCKYQQFSVDTPENRLIKKALIFSRKVLLNPAIAKQASKLQMQINQFISAFENVDEQIELWEIKSIKHNKLYREYDEAIRLAQLILRRYDYNITNITPAEEEKCPVFWLDMSLLYEHYILGLLRKRYGNMVTYQAEGYTGYPDFICKSPQIVMDTKYIPKLDASATETYIVRQLSGYARDKKLFPVCNTIIPCIVIYPKQGATVMNPFETMEIDQLIENGKEDGRAHGFYKIAVPLPILA